MPSSFPPKCFIYSIKIFVLTDAAAMVKEEWGLPATQTSTAPGQPMPKNLSTGAAYGLHPEEGPGKSKEGELVAFASLL